MVRYRTVKELAAALAQGVIPADVVSPGYAAAALGVTRQALHQRLSRGTLQAWTAEGLVLVDERAVRAEVRRKRRIAESQGELNVST